MKAAFLATEKAAPLQVQEEAPEPLSGLEEDSLETSPVGAPHITAALQKPGLSEGLGIQLLSQSCHRSKKKQFGVVTYYFLNRQLRATALSCMAAWCQRSPSFVDSGRYSSGTSGRLWVTHTGRLPSEPLHL